MSRTVFDAASRRTVRRVPVGPAPHHVAFSPDGGRAYVVSEARRDVSEIDVAAGRVRNRIPVGRAPHGVAVR